MQRSDACIPLRCVHFAVLAFYGTDRKYEWRAKLAVHLCAAIAHPLLPEVRRICTPASGATHDASELREGLSQSFVLLVALGWL